MDRRSSLLHVHSIFFELGEEARLLTDLFLGHNDTFYFTDMTKDPGLELVAYDTSWALLAGFLCQLSCASDGLKT